MRDSYATDSARIQREFEATSDGRKATQDRAALVDEIVLQLSRELLPGGPENIEKLCLVALGGYGRRELFPFSDIDLLFLAEDAGTENKYRDAMRAISQSLWDIRLRLSPANRLLTECETFHRSNPEFAVSLLDHRYWLATPGCLPNFGKIPSRV